MKRRSSSAKHSSRCGRQPNSPTAVRAVSAGGHMGMGGCWVHLTDIRLRNTQDSLVQICFESWIKARPLLS